MCVLHDNLMLASLKITGWTPRKYNKRASHEVAEANGADESQTAPRVNVPLLAKNALAAWVRATGTARTFHYDHTTPWMVDGSQVLTTAMYFDYVRTMGELKEQAMSAAGTFIKNYPEYCADAKRSLGKLYNPRNYPSQMELQAKFTFDWKLMPLPQAGNLVTDLVQEEHDRLVSEIDRQVNNALSDATYSLWSKLYEVVGNLARKMREEGKGKAGRVIFRDSLVDNIRDLVSAMPKLMPTADQDLADMAAEVELKLAGLNTGDLREFPAERESAAKEAEDIMAKMSKFM